MSALVRAANFFHRFEMVQLSPFSLYKQIGEKYSGLAASEIYMNLRKRGLIMPILAKVSELTVNAIVSCPKSVVESGFVRVVALRPIEQVSPLSKWTILGVECNENGVAKNSNSFSITQEEINRWQQ